MGKVYEKYIKLDNGKFLFVGWSPIDDEIELKYEISAKSARGFLYRTIRWLDGKTDIIRYRLDSGVEI